MFFRNCQNNYENVQGPISQRDLSPDLDLI